MHDCARCRCACASSTQHRRQDAACPHRHGRSLVRRLFPWTTPQMPALLAAGVRRFLVDGTLLEPAELSDQTERARRAADAARAGRKPAPRQKALRQAACLWSSISHGKPDFRPSLFTPGDDARCVAARREMPCAKRPVCPMQESARTGAMPASLPLACSTSAKRCSRSTAPPASSSMGTGRVQSAHRLGAPCRRTRSHRPRCAHMCSRGPGSPAARSRHDRHRALFDCGARCLRCADRRARCAQALPCRRRGPHTLGSARYSRTDWQGPARCAAHASEPHRQRRSHGSDRARPKAHRWPLVHPPRPQAI